MPGCQSRPFYGLQCSGAQVSHCGFSDWPNPRYADQRMAAQQADRDHSVEPRRRPVIEPFIRFGFIFGSSSGLSAAGTEGRRGELALS